MIKEKLKNMRILAGLSIREAGRQGPCSAQYISQLEKGYRTNPSLPMLRGLVEVYQKGRGIRLAREAGIKGPVDKNGATSYRYFEQAKEEISLVDLI